MSWEWCLPNLPLVPFSAWQPRFRSSLSRLLVRVIAGHIMVPVSWEQMQCPVTQVKEYRKVAKVEDVK
jgi:hypothetical protein